MREIMFYYGFRRSAHQFKTQDWNFQNLRKCLCHRRQLGLKVQYQCHASQAHHCRFSIFCCLRCIMRFWWYRSGSAVRPLREFGRTKTGADECATICRPNKGEDTCSCNWIFNIKGIDTSCFVSIAMWNQE